MAAMYIEGYPVVFNQRSRMPNGTYEVIHPGAFSNADMSDFYLQYNHHDSVLILASVKARTLAWAVDKRGLHIVANIADTHTGRDVYELIRRRDLQKMSFAFTAAEDEFDRASQTRKILKFKRIYDVSVVNFPAYSQTDVHICSEATWHKYADTFDARMKLIEDINRMQMQESIRKMLSQ